MKNIQLLFIALGVIILGSFTQCKRETNVRINSNFQSSPEIEALKINEIQVIGSHNSYRRRTYQPVYDFVLSIKDLLPAQYDPLGWDYDHLPIPEQLGFYGMRSLEIDVYNDPRGGHFYNRAGNFFVNQPVASGIPDLKTPGFKVLHIPDFDYRTNYYTFKQALLAVKNWSNKNPNHVPIFIMIESKSLSIGDVVPLPGFVKTIPYTAASADAIDQEIRSVFGNSLSTVITPDKVRESFTTLNEAVLAGNWPTLAEARGKVAFILQGDLIPYYLGGHPSLQGRAMFTFAEPGSDEAAFVILNNPVEDFTQIQAAIRAGYIVRTMSDGGTNQARTGDYSKMNAAFQSGAHIISTDYYRPDPRHTTSTEWTDYTVRFPDNTAHRINPVTATDRVDLGYIAE